jgi:hypothetical protein
MKKGLLLIFFGLSLGLNAQWLWDYGGSIGATNYLGDIGGKEKTRRDFVSDMKLSKTRWNAGMFARYKWRQNVSFKFGFDYLRIEGDDKLSTNPGRHYRNFNFKNDVFALTTTAAYFFYTDPDLGNTYRYKNSFRAYVFGGVGGFYTNPKSLYQGTWVKMSDFFVEGYEYKKVVLGVPVGFGMYFTFNKRNRWGFEFNYMKTFTDYLDDISGNYPDAPGPSDPYTAGLTLRTTELSSQELSDNLGASRSHDWGQKRGDPTNKDAIVYVTFSYSKVIRGKSSFYRSKHNSFLGKNRKKVRKIRAKF